MIHQWSLEHNPSTEILVEGVVTKEANINVTIFQTEPVIELSAETLAYNWNKLHKTVKKFDEVRKFTHNILEL